MTKKRLPSRSSASSNQAFEHGPVQFFAIGARVGVAAHTVQVARLARAHQEEVRRQHPVALPETFFRVPVALQEQVVAHKGTQNRPASGRRKLVLRQGALDGMQHRQAEIVAILLHPDRPETGCHGGLLNSLQSLLSRPHRGPAQRPDAGQRRRRANKKIDPRVEGEPLGPAAAEPHAHRLVAAGPVIRRRFER